MKSLTLIRRFKILELFLAKFTTTRKRLMTGGEMIVYFDRVEKKIEKELSYPGQIKVMVIRETRAVEYAK